MPMGWIPPEVFLKHKDVTIYHIYKDDDINNSPREYWYGTSEGCSDGDCWENNNGTFDVRSLPSWNSFTNLLTEERIKATIKAAIDDGTLVSQD